MKIKKKFLGQLLLGAGGLLIAFSLYGMSRLSDAREGVDSATKPFSSRPAGRAVQGALDERIGAYAAPMTLCMVGGIALALTGGYIFYKNRRK